MQHLIRKTKPILNFRQALIYGIGIFGLQIGIGLVNSFQAEFFNKNYGASLMIVAGIILGAKILSIIVDFLIGNMIDRSKFKKGKMRPWIFISAFPFVIITMLMFVVIPFSTLAGKYVYILFITIIWNILMSLADIPSQGMLALLSPNANERDMAAGISNSLKAMGLSSPGVFATIVCFMTGSETIGQKEYLILAGIICTLGLALFLLIYFYNKENIVSNSSAGMSLREMFHELKNNKMIIILFLTFILGFGRNIALGIQVQGTTILLREGIHFNLGSFAINATGDKMSWVMGITAGITSTISILSIPFVNKRWGEKKTFIVYGIYMFVVCTIAFSLYASGIPQLRNLWAILGFNFFIGFSFGPQGYLPMVMTSDIVDYQEWKTGKRTEGAQFAILSLSVKLANALSVAFAIFMVGAIGYSAESYYTHLAVGGAENIANYITDGMQTKLFAIMFFVPGICGILSTIPMWFYKIDKNTKIKMRSALAIKRVKEQRINNMLGELDENENETLIDENLQSHIVQKEICDSGLLYEKINKNIHETKNGRIVVHDPRYKDIHGDEFSVDFSEIENQIKMQLGVGLKKKKQIEKTSHRKRKFKI